jgi:hypothetical protein
VASVVKSAVSSVSKTPIFLVFDEEELAVIAAAIDFMSNRLGRTPVSERIREAIHETLKY